MYDHFTSPAMIRLASVAVAAAFWVSPEESAEVVYAPSAVLLGYECHKAGMPGSLISIPQALKLGATNFPRPCEPPGPLAL